MYCGNSWLPFQLLMPAQRTLAMPPRLVFAFQRIEWARLARVPDAPEFSEVAHNRRVLSGVYCCSEYRITFSPIRAASSGV